MASKPLIIRAVQNETADLGFEFSVGEFPTPRQSIWPDGQGLRRPQMRLSHSPELGGRGSIARRRRSRRVRAIRRRARNVGGRGAAAETIVPLTRILRRPTGQS